LRITITASRPGKRVSAMPAPNGTPIRPPSTTAERLTTSDSRTMANSAGSPASTSCRAEASTGIEPILSARMLHFVEKSSI
jgi:hypothetical protein